LGTQIKKIKIIALDQHNDGRGKMIVAEASNNIPFEIKRIFYIYETDNDAIRGCHANRKTQFVMICVHGTVTVKVKALEYEKVFILDSPDKGLYLPEMTWKEMYDFTSGSVLLVLASEIYDGDEYIRNYEEFLRDASLNNQY
jgi:dTDP-4-dehydrorhamnose 3,5-epimerase-like enzyme